TLCQLSYTPATETTKRPLAGAPSIEQPATRLLDDLGDDAGADGTTAFTDGEAQTFFHRDRGDQLHRDRHVVARHHHLGAFRQRDRTGHVRRTEVELRTVVGEERGVTTTLFLAQHVDLAREVRVRGDGTRLAQHLTTLDLLALGAAQQHADVVTGRTLVEQLAEHLHARAGGLGRGLDADDLDLVTDLDDAALDTASHHGATTRNREHVFDRQQERLVDGALRRRNVAVERFGQTQDRRLADVRLVTL